MFSWKRLESKKIVFALLLLAAVGLHGWYFLQIAPKGLNQDEAALLLNARFLFESGRDEWGQSWPVVFRSFGDAKLPGMIYFTSLLGSVFGFANWTVRLPSFLASLALPFLVGAWARRLSGKESVGLLASLLMLMSPWAYHYGSHGFEANVGLALFLASLLIWFRAQSSWRSDVLAVFLSLAAGLTYNAPFLLLPFVGLGLVWQRWQNWSSIGRAGGFLVTAFALILSLTWGATSQKQGIAFFQDATVLSEYPAYRASFDGLAQKILGNRWVYWGGIALRHVADSFSWKFLVEQGGNNPWHAIPWTGHVPFMIPITAALSLGSLVRGLSQKKRSAFRAAVLIVGLTLASLIPAVITTDAPHATRSLFFFVMLTVLSALSFAALYDRACLLSDRYRLAKFSELGLATLLIAGFAVWWLPAASRWQKGIDPHWYPRLEEALSRSEVRRAERIFIVDPEGVLYTRVALYEQLTPEKFAQTFRRSAPATTGLVRGEQLGRYFFVFQASDALAPGVLVEQQEAPSWSTIEL